MNGHIVPEDLMSPAGTDVGTTMGLSTAASTIASTTASSTTGHPHLLYPHQFPSTYLSHASFQPLIAFVNHR